MKRSALLLTFLLCCSVSASSDSPKRPRILGIAAVDIYVTSIEATRSFYSKVLDARPCHWCEEIPRSPAIVPLNAEQFVMLWTSPTPPPSNLISEIEFSTDNLKAMKQFLTANKIAFTFTSPEAPIMLTDPEGHRIAFTQYRTISPSSVLNASPIHVIHAGFVVRDRAAEDKFYRDILGFHVYWHGGMKDDETNWVDMQVPDGTDWIEYMLNVPENADHHTLGVMNHIALGVKDIKPAAERLRENGAAPILEQPKIGRDGKWQLNLYDPDDTRVEFMEFTPVQKPCCSEYTGPHPKP